MTHLASARSGQGNTLDPSIVAVAGGHTLPSSRPVLVHSRVPFSVYKQPLAILTAELPVVKPYGGGQRGAEDGCTRSVLSALVAERA